MKMIFDRNGEGRQELVVALGMISDSLDYSKWKPVLPLAARQLTCISRGGRAFGDSRPLLG